MSKYPETPVFIIKFIGILFLVLLFLVKTSSQAVILFVLFIIVFTIIILLLEKSKKYSQSTESENEKTYSQSRDKENIRNNISNTDQEVLQLFLGFTDFVAMLRKVAKSEGVITKDEMRVIDNFFDNILHLNPKQRKKAILLFEQSKDTNTPFEVYARHFHSDNKNDNKFLETIVDVLTRVACVDGQLSAEAEILLNQAIAIFEVDGTYYHEYKSFYDQKKAATRVQGKVKYYANVLGLQNEITPEKIKIAYRKLASQYHPDKVSHLGHEFTEIAEKKMKNINEAYDYLQKEYGF